MVNVALLGAGMMAETHAKAYSKMKDVRLKYIFNRNESRGRELAGQFGARYVSDVGQIFGDPDVQFIDVCLPTFLHEEMVTKAANAGKHILCEKPFALNVNQATRMMDAVRKNGVKLMVAHVLRFWPEYVVIRDAIRAGRIGEPIFAKAARISERPIWNEWCKDPTLSGGAILDLQIHDLDLLTWLFGMPTKLYAQGIQSEHGAWDHVMTTLSYGNGLKAFCESGVMMPNGYPFTMEIRVTGTKGSIEFLFKAGVGNVESRDSAAQTVVLYQSGRKPEVLIVPEEDGYENEIRYFVDSIVSGREVERIKPDEVLSVLGLIEHSITSLESGLVVHL